jgi:hypothetical protein
MKGHPSMLTRLHTLAASAAVLSLLAISGADAQNRQRSMYSVEGASGAPTTTQSTGSARNIAANLSPTVSVGQTVVIKGVRGASCGQAPGAISPLPTSTLGRFTSGPVGTMNSRSCGSTPARELRFTATKAGTETLSVFEDTVTITVR